MPVISKFVDASNCAWEFEGNTVCYGVAGYLRVEELPEFIAWLQSEYDKCEKPEAEEDDGWMEWEGGECPVDANCEVAIRLRGGSVTWHIPAWQCSWEHEGGPNDIVAYRIVK